MWSATFLVTQRAVASGRYPAADSALLPGDARRERE
jgi:hypothetical protein